jgi:hypothetical protein
MYKSKAEALNDLKKMIDSQAKAIRMTADSRNNLVSVAEDVGPRFSDEMDHLLRQNAQLCREMDMLMLQLQKLRAALK